MGEITNEGLDAELQEVKKHISRINEERQTILYRLRKKLVSDTEGDKQLLATGHERDQLEAKKETLEAHLRDKEGQRGRLSAAEALLLDIRKRLNNVDESVKRNMIETLVSGISVTLRADKSPHLAVTYLFEPKRGIADNTPSAAELADAPAPGGPSRP